MSGTCDICGGKTGLFNTFHCQDGTICKNCYKIVSGNYADTVAGRTLVELKRLYIRNAEPLDLGEAGFLATRRVSSYLLLDDRSRQLCIPNNRKLTRRNTRPEIFPYDALKGFALVSEPAYPSLPPDRDAVVDRLAVRLELEGIGRREIVIIPTPVRTSGFAFRQGLKIANAIMDSLASI